MPKIHVTDEHGGTKVIDAENDISLMEVLRNAGYSELLAICGGCRSCATCHVYIEPERFAETGAVTTDELELLESSAHVEPTSRLSCQVQINDTLEGLRVTIAPAD